MDQGNGPDAQETGSHLCAATGDRLAQSAIKLHRLSAGHRLR